MGKTLSSMLIAQALYRRKDPRTDYAKGQLYITGNNYLTTNETTIEAHRLTLRRTIMEFLQRCPDALIVVDEVELFHFKLITVFQEFLDYTYPIKQFERMFRLITDTKRSK